MHLRLPILPSSSSKVESEFLHEYAKHVTFTTRQEGNMRNLALEAALELIGEASVQRLVRCVEIDLDGWLTVSLALKGHEG